MHLVSCLITGKKDQVTRRRGSSYTPRTVDGADVIHRCLCNVINLNQEVEEKKKQFWRADSKHKHDGADVCAAVSQFTSDPTR